MIRRNVRLHSPFSGRCRLFRFGSASTMCFTDLNRSDVMMNPRINRTVMLSVLVVLAMSCATYACPMCKDSIPNSDASAAVALPTGFNYSVYTLLVGFLVVLASVSGMIFKAVRETSARPGFQIDPRDPKK